MSKYITYRISIRLWILVEASLQFCFITYWLRLICEYARQYHVVIEADLQRLQLCDRDIYVGCGQLKTRYGADYNVWLRPVYNFVL